MMSAGGILVFLDRIGARLTFNETEFRLELDCKDGSVPPEVLAAIGQQNAALIPIVRDRDKHRRFVAEAKRMFPGSAHVEHKWRDRA